MSEIAKKGKQLFEAGYSCSEATWLAFNQDLSEEMLNFGLKLSGGFSGGLAVGNICGAISGIVLSLGRKYGRSMGEERSEELREKVKMIIFFAEESYKNINCEEIRPKEDYRPFCAELVEKLLEYAVTLMD